MESLDQILGADSVFHLIADHIKDFALFLLDPEGKVATWNETAQQFLGYMAPEVMGKPLSLFFIPEDVTAGVVARMLEEARRNGRSEFNGWHLRRDGSRCWVQSFLSPLTNGQGKTLGFVKLVRDTTDQKVLSEHLVDAQARFEAVFEKGPDAVVVIEDDGTILEGNPAFGVLLGLDREGFLGRKLQDFYEATFDLPEVRRKVWEKGSFRGLARLRGTGGRTPEVEIDVKGQILEGQSLVVLRDVTERAQLQKQAALNDKLVTVGTLAAGVAHEINNPLAYILGNLETVRDLLEAPDAALMSWKDLSDARGLVRDCLKGSQRIRDIVRGLKSFSRSGGEEMSEVQLAELLDSAISMTLHEIRYKAKVERHYEPGLPPLVANVTRLQQVFVNLLLNSAHAIAPGNVEGNRIQVSLAREGDQVAVRVADSGKGIPPEVLPRIFDPFFTTKPVGQGTGLGLSISRDIIRGYGGEISVESEPGKGTVFTIRLPIATDRSPNARSMGEKTPDLSGLKVLVVDDEAANVALFTRMLRRHRHEVVSTTSALEALGILRKGLTRFDAVVSDLNMPDMSGVEFYKQVGRLDEALTARIVFVSGGVFDREMEAFLDRLPNPRLEKPFKIEDLLRAIAHVQGPK
ncbi:MAG TPA: ATP-binding protein [bacterium]|nr:ATP-binding protein [bacterium]